VVVKTCGGPVPLKWAVGKTRRQTCTAACTRAMREHRAELRKRVVPCALCGCDFEQRDPKKRFCSDRCRRRRDEAPKPTQTDDARLAAMVASETLPRFLRDPQPWTDVVYVRRGQAAPRQGGR
jgi:hypothetical protein